MKIKKIRQTGYSHIALVFVVVFVGLLVFAGIRVVGSQRLAVNNKTEAESAAVAVPPGWKLFADTSIGVRFFYPEVYGSFTRPTDKVSKDFESALVSGRLTTDYVPGVAGQFMLGTYKNASPELTTRRYGPKVKLSGGTWVVTEPNQYDDKQYQKGDVFPEMTHANVRGIDVYTAKSGDEGISVYRIYFVSQGKMHMLQLPPFNSDLGTSTYNVNDQAAYDTLYVGVRDSITLY